MGTRRPAIDDFSKSRKLAVKSVLPMPSASARCAIGPNQRSLFSLSVAICTCSPA